jgi:hypothetical protein
MSEEQYLDPCSFVGEDVLFEQKSNKCDDRHMPS